MRPNAPILAVLALAATSLLHAEAHALPHLKKHDSTVKTPKSNHGKLSPEARKGLKEHKAHMAEAKNAHAHKAALTRPASPAAADRVHAFVEAQNQASNAGHAPAHTSSQTAAHSAKAAQHTRHHHRPVAEQAAAVAPRKATSADFLASANVAANGSSKPAGEDEAPNAAATQHPEVGQSAAAAIPHASHQAALDATLAPAQVAANQAPIPTVDEAVTSPFVLHALYNKYGRLIMPPPLKGSHEILLRQNQVADSEGLDRIRDDNDLERMRTEHLLVPIPTGNGLHIDDRLPENRRYCRPWTALFLNQLGREYYARFQKPLQVNSAVRTVEFQHHLIHINGNAAPADGDTASPHLTGQAIDLAKHGLSMTEIAWLRGYLLPLVQQGKVDVEEEFQQSCFHISVYEKFMPQPSTRRSIASNHRSGTSVLATSLP